MDNYLDIPRVSAGEYASNTDYYQEGVVLFDTDVINNYKIAYTSLNPYSLRIGFWSDGVGGDSIKHFVIVSRYEISDVDIRLISPAMSLIERIISVTNYSSVYNCYYAEFTYSSYYMEFKTIRFDSLNSLLEALSSDSPAPPSPSSGVVVTVIASPEYTPPSVEGVIVTVIARLLDPNQQGGQSETGGGQGTFDNTSDIISIPPMPTLSASGCGLVTLFRPSMSELQALGAYLWTNITDFIENLNKLFMNPMDYIISLNIFPCNPSVGPTRPINIGSVTTSITMPPVTSQWYEFDCGFITISEYWGSALDYAPNTKISLFLPFIGSVGLNTDEVMGKRLSIKYRIDLLSGQCVAMVSVADLNSQNSSVYYQFTGECAVSVPLTGADWSRIYSAAIGAIGAAVTGGIAASAAGSAAGSATSALAGARAAEAVANTGLAYSTINDTSKGIPGVQQMRQNMLQASQMALNAGRQAASAPATVASGIHATRIANTVNNTIGHVMSGKAIVSHTGTVSGNAGMLGVKVPYVIIEYPNQSLAENYKHFVGYPSNLYAKLGDLSGYTECEQIIATALRNQTDSEMSELIEALKGGVYL